jgi:hypothetical protein
MQQPQLAHQQPQQQPPPQHMAQQPVPSMGQPTPGSWNVGAPGPSYPPQHAAPAAPYMPASPAAPMPPGAALGYGFGYAPGSRVTVTWSNGQRYPGTIQQVSGSQCLVVFPDGQQHWVEMQYLAPA